MPPAWLAELSEEWPEEEEEQRENNNNDDEETSRLDFGSLAIGDNHHHQHHDIVSQSPPSPGLSSLLKGRDTSYQHHGSILFSPVKKKQNNQATDHSSRNSILNNASPPSHVSPSNQLAMAAAAFKKDLLQDGQQEDVDIGSSIIIDDNVRQDTNTDGGPPTPAKRLQQQPPRHTPNRLQSLFMQPLSPKSEKQFPAASGSVIIQDEQHRQTPLDDNHLSLLASPALHKEERDIHNIEGRTLQDNTATSFQEVFLDSLERQGSMVDLQHTATKSPASSPTVYTTNVPIIDVDEANVSASQSSQNQDPNHSQMATQQLSFLGNADANANIDSHLPSIEFSFRVEPRQIARPLSSYLVDDASIVPEAGSSSASHLSVLRSRSSSASLHQYSTHVGTGEAVVATTSASATTSTPSSISRAAQTPSPGHPSIQQQQKHSRNPSNHKNSHHESPPLNMFKFQHDSQTRQHLHALVAELDGLTSPPRSDTNNIRDTSFNPLDISDSQFRGLSKGLLTASRGPHNNNNHKYDYDAPPSTSNPPSTQTREYSFHTAAHYQSPYEYQSHSQSQQYHHQDYDQDIREEHLLQSARSNLRSRMHPTSPHLDLEDENGRLANTRSSKRVRLTMSDLRPSKYGSTAAPSPAPGSPARIPIQNRVMPRSMTPSRKRQYHNFRSSPFNASSSASASRLLYSHRSAPAYAFADRQQQQWQRQSQLSSASPSRPPLRTLPPMTAPVKRTYKASMLQYETPNGRNEEQKEQQEEEEVTASASAMIETPVREHTSEIPDETPTHPATSIRGNNSTDALAIYGKTPAHVVQNRLQEAKALMERIKLRNAERQASSTGSAVILPSSGKSPAIALTPEPPGPESSAAYLGSRGAKRKPMDGQSTLSRPPNPTPSAAALAHAVAERVSASARSLAPTLENVEEQSNLTHVQEVEEEDSITRSAANPGDDPEPGLEDLSTPDEERLDSLAPLPQIGHNSHVAVASIRQTLSTRPLVNKANAQSMTVDGPSIVHMASASGSGSRRTFATAPGAQNRQLLQPRVRPPPPSTISHTSSDRFFTSTSTRIASNSTAPTSLVASSIGTIKDYQHMTTINAHRGGLVNIPPDAAENLLTGDVLGDMIFDEENKRWMKIQEYKMMTMTTTQIDHDDDLLSPARQLDLPALSPVEELPDRHSDSAAEDDPFRDLTGTDGGRSRLDYTTGSSNRSLMQRHSRSGSLILPPHSNLKASIGAESDRQTEKTSTPPHNSSVAAPFVSPDIPSIPQASSREPDSLPGSNSNNVATTSNTLSSSNTSQSDVQRFSTFKNPVKSVLKRSDGNAFSTPLPSSRMMALIGSKQTRSVSFSDGKLPGKSDTFESKGGKVRASALRTEIGYGDHPADIDEEGGSGSNAQRGGTSQFDHQTQGHVPESHTFDSENFDERDGGPYGRVMRERQASLANSMVSTTSTLAWHRKPLNANATMLTECSFGVSYDRLLRVLTEAVPFEPSWKDIKTIDLQERGMETVVRLKEFMPHLDEINLSNNSLSYLTGLPSSLRFLALVNNKLSDLSSFTYLRNLEEVNISGNPGISSIQQLSCLQHLRALKADGCSIQDFHGIDQLDGLVSLSMCNNALTEIRLDETAWHRLETLDLSDNDITHTSGVETLPLLRSLNLDFNKLHDFEMVDRSKSLRILKISNNHLTALDLSTLPNVRTVFADSNRIGTLTGTQRLRKLENLSLREQRHSSIEFPVKDLRDLRRLYLSYNPTPAAFPSEHFLNLTLLELSGCRLSALPANFSSLVPNCRVLILDNNFLTDLGPVTGATRLRAISAVGNRLDKIRPLLGLWTECTELESVDLRLNPITLGLYATPNVSVVPPNLNLLMEEDKVSLKAFKALDVQHKITLPNEWLARRTAYRALLVEAIPTLRLLDGLKIGRLQRHRARELVERFAS